MLIATREPDGERADIPDTDCTARDQPPRSGASVRASNRINVSPDAVETNAVTRGARGPAASPSMPPRQTRTAHNPVTDRARMHHRPVDRTPNVL